MGYTGSSFWVGAKAKDIIQDELPSWNILRTETKGKAGGLAMTLEVISFGDGQYNTQFFKKVGTRTYGCDAAGNNLVRLRFKIETSGYEWQPVKMNDIQLADMCSALGELDSRTKKLCDDLVWLLKDRTDMFYADLNWYVKNLNVEQFSHAYTYVLQMLRNYGVRFFTSD